MTPRLSFNVLVLIGSAAFVLASSALLYALPPSRIDRHLIRGSFRPYEGFAYLKPVKYIDGDLSGARLYEDDKLLGPAESDLREIETKGDGRFSLQRHAWEVHGAVLMFSTSDNTDPNTNGRKYHLR